MRTVAWWWLVLSVGGWVGVWILVSVWIGIVVSCVEVG